MMDAVVIAIDIMFLVALGLLASAIVYQCLGIIRDKNKWERERRALEVARRLLGK